MQVDAPSSPPRDAGALPNTDSLPPDFTEPPVMGTAPASLAGASSPIPFAQRKRAQGGALRFSIGRELRKATKSMAVQF